MTILGQNPGADEELGQRVVGYKGRNAVYEECEPQPFVGKTGWELTQRYLPLAGLTRDEVSMCNVLKCRWVKHGKRTNDLPTGRLLGEAVEYCTRVHLKIPESTELVVAVGGLAWQAMGGPGTISEWRGHLR